MSYTLEQIPFSCSGSLSTEAGLEPMNPRGLNPAARDATSRNALQVLGVMLLGVAANVGPVEAHGSESAGRDRFVSHTRQLTYVGQRAGEGYFSPDGKQMILQSERYPNNPFFQIYILDLVTGDCDLVSSGMGRTTCSYFRAGSDQVLFASTHLDPEAQTKQRKEYEERNNPNRPHVPWVYDEYFDIFASDHYGGRLQRLTESPGYDAEGAYSPDGKLVVFMSMRDAYPLEKLTPEQRAQWDKDPSYFGELYLMNADGTNQRRLTDWPGYDGGPFFTFDGERVIWRHFEENGMIADIYTINVDGTDRRRLTDFKAMSWAPYMHPSGSYAVFASNKLGFANFELFMVDALGEKEPVRVTYTEGFDGLPVFSPNGKQLSWTSNRVTRERQKAQLFLADWDHQAALISLREAPPRGTPAPEYHPTGACDNGWPGYGLPQPDPGLKPEITPDDLYEHVSFLASDKLAGRMTGSEGEKLAGEYIAARFKEAGLEPLGDDGTYFQAFPFPAGIELVPDKNEMSFVAGMGMGMGMGGQQARKTYMGTVNDDYLPLSFTSNAAAEGSVVFAGYGLVIPKEGDNPEYDSYANLDVKDKIVLVLEGVPEQLEQTERIRFSHYSGVRYKAKLAQQRGAAGFLLVTGPNTAGTGKLIPLGRTGSDAGIVAASISVSAADGMLAPRRMTLAQLQTALDSGKITEEAKRAAECGTMVKLTTHLERKEGQGRNVVGMLPPVGRGRHAGEFVLIGAHYDHIGHGVVGSRARAGEEGQIHNGADDNASGDATVLELAAYFAEARKQAPADQPQRGLIFACWSGEEIGVIGSTYFARHAPYPLGRLAAYVNFDMVGRMNDGRLILQGLGSSPDWQRMIEKINIQVPLALVLQEDPYLPTDTHEFYPNGVPIISFFTGVHDDYNRPTDDADTLNYNGMQAVAQWGQHLIAELARQPERLSYAEVKRTMPQGGGGGRGRTYTGMIPDFAAADVAGMKISGTQGGSPAEKAGLKPGDVIVKFAGQDIRGLEDYAAVLRAVKAGDTVDIVVQRDGQEVALKITPGTRK